MAALFRTLRQTTKLLWKPPLLPRQHLHTALNTISETNDCVLRTKCQKINGILVKRQASSDDSYDPYPEFETPSPYKEPRQYRYGYQYKYYSGGVLPRPEGHFEDEPLPIKVKPYNKKDAWTREKALFGQNDYIDILGDGTIHPSELMEGPEWLRAFKGHEFQRLLREMEHRGEYLKANQPTKYHDMCKRLFFLYKRLNRRHHAGFWGSRTRAAHSRIDRLRKD